MRPALIAFVLLAFVPARVMASADPQAIAVLDVEQRWLAATVARDPAALGKILAENFVHTNYRGAVTYREAELANVTKPKPYTEKTSEQTVDFASSTVAIVHGLNTVWQNGNVIVRLRYTDVYVKQDGAWKALSAQETPVTR